VFFFKSKTIILPLFINFFPLF